MMYLSGSYHAIGPVIGREENAPQLLATVLVHLDYYNKLPQTGWLIKNGNLSLTVLEAGESTIHGLGKVSFW